MSGLTTHGLTAARGLVVVTVVGGTDSTEVTVVGGTDSEGTFVVVELGGKTEERKLT